MEKGAEAVHAANPNVLVMFSGLRYDVNFSFIRDRAVQLSFKGKLVFEAHWYAFTDREVWVQGNLNQVCAQIYGNITTNSAFLLKQGWPLFFGEFGVGLRGTNLNDNRYIPCFMALAADLDFDWAYWTLFGSYYFRQGIVGMEEFYGLLSPDRATLRNTTFLPRISSLQLPFRGPGIIQGSPYKVIYHPLTGLCLTRKSKLAPLRLGPCSISDSWEYTPQKTLTIQGTYYCLQADQEGNPAKLGIICSASNSKWETISDSKLHFSSNLTHGSKEDFLNLNNLLHIGFTV
ncbi:hypothetical protein PIB30_010333 [Stylosanthes scabra]|uniref:Glycoside hydrolase family 5 domain-containing protein n=1 Tax=Stylosanthes scabra TaxID=79078 RepID=A0ABU6V4I6_9FABA|nr:hypothetical protein [Stylosanthes scabra]